MAIFDQKVEHGLSSVGLILTKLYVVWAQHPKHRHKLVVLFSTKILTVDLQAGRAQLCIDFELLGELMRRQKIHYII